MKKPKLLRLRIFTRLWPGKRRRGVAIITVLAIVSLMTILIISFFQMAQTAKTTAVNSVEMERVVTLKDVITNYVTAQIRTATTLHGGATQTIWTSQPGAIRTYHGSNPAFNRLYKLYSSDKMLIDQIERDSSGALLNQIENDVEPQWDQYPDQYVDMNRPVRPASSERETENLSTVKARLIYPIVDPSRYNGQENDPTRNTEGFVYGERRLSSRSINGVDPSKSQLAMPVRWIYLLRDGTAGVVDRDGSFVALQKDGGEATAANPIVSRIAWWTDDESCKINVNTASIPIPWDTPRTNSIEDVWYAQYQPVSGECQHYPGHPAQTDISAVLFPGFRYSPDTTVMPIGDMRLLPLERAKLVWNITPYITETGGTNGGKQKVAPLTVTPVPLDTEDHLFATFEEMYFKARRAEKNLDRPRESVARDDVSGELLARLEGSQFFLTTRSNSPEMTVFNTPRVCMFPMNGEVVAEVGKASGAVNPRVGTYEVTMATNSTIGADLGRIGKPFYFQRSTNSDSRHNAFYNSNDGRNVQIFKYLKKLSISIPPGYPELSGEFNTFAKKYPGPNRDRGNNRTTSDFDSSDRTQILLTMLDMLRSSNMSPGYLESGNSYDGGNGQVSGICGCQARTGDPQPPHTTAMKIVDGGDVIYTPKGSGRTYGPAEICLFAIIPAVKKGGQVIGTAPNILNPDMRGRWASQEIQDASLIQLGVLVNSFSPRQGWSPMFGQAGVNISTHRDSGGGDPRSPRDGTTPAPFVLANNGDQPETPFYIGDQVDGVGRAPGFANRPPGLVPWGGIAGPRVTATQTVAVFDPYVYQGPGAGQQTATPVQLKWRNREILRVFFYEGPATNYNTNQAVEIDLTGQTIEMIAAYTGQPAATYVPAAAAGAPGTFPPPALRSLSSLVVPHGDYRLTTIPLRVERGIFVPHASYSHCLVEPLLVGTNSNYQPVGAPNFSLEMQLLSDNSRIARMDITYAPHFAPARREFLCNESLGTKPTDQVFQASSAVEERRWRFAHGRRDGQYSIPLFNPWRPADQQPKYPYGQNTVANRGSSDPLETGDFDNGNGLCPDGAYMNQPDDGDARDRDMPYYRRLDQAAAVNPATFSPNRVLRSPVDFGSIPSGVQARVPWQTLRFRPDPGMYSARNIMTSVSSDPPKPDGYNHYFPFSNYCGPKDHLLLDMWWMPVVEPWALSEGFATKGQINLNQQILPFTFIERTTALHALLRSERMMAIPDSAAQKYKNGNVFPNNDIYRHWINAKETIRQLTDFRWRGQDVEGFTLPFNTFRSASEICELWLVPEKNGSGDERGEWNLDYMVRQFWQEHRLTGDNMRERPYSNLYPRVTVRSNVFRVHMIAQTLKKASSNKPDSFKSVSEEGTDPDLITSEWRGSALIERVLNPNERELQTFDYAPGINEAVVDSTVPRFPPEQNLNNFYTYRVTEVKAFTQ